MTQNDFDIFENRFSQSLSNALIKTILMADTSATGTLWLY